MNQENPSQIEEDLESLVRAYGNNTKWYEMDMVDIFFYLFFSAYAKLRKPMSNRQRLWGMGCMALFSGIAFKMMHDIGRGNSGFWFWWAISQFCAILFWHWLMTLIRNRNPPD